MFRQVQDQVTDSLYVAPARKLAEDNVVRSALGLAILVDTAVQHGTENDPTASPRWSENERHVGGTPADGVDETTWLKDFLNVRRTTLEHPSSSDTGDAWRDSVGRVDALEALLDAGNLDLETPFTINPLGDPRRSARTSTSGVGDDLLRSVCRRAAAAGRPLPSRSRRGRLAQRAAWRG